MNPYNGSVNRRFDGASDSLTDTCADSQERLGVLFGALAAEIAPVSPDLADLLTAWPTLPEPVKAGIVAMVKAACPEHGGSACPKAGKRGG